MNLIEKQWDKTLLTLTYGDGYDSRLHAVQVALNLLGRRSSTTGANMGKINFTSVRFGYFDVETEDAILSFQRAVGLHDDGVLDQVTYESIFAATRKDLRATVTKNDGGTLQIEEIESDANSGQIGSNISSNTNTNTDTVFGEGGYIIDSYYSSSNKDVINDLYTKQYGKNSDITIDSYWSSLVGQPNLELLSYSTTRPVTLGSGGSYGPGDSNSPSYSRIKSNNDNDGLSYIDNLLANSIYYGNLNSEKADVWTSNSKMNININGYTYDESYKHDTFFSPRNSSITRKSKYDITIVYGANGQFARRLLGVTHRARTQQVDPSGEAIFDVIEFIAKDVIETDNHR